MVPRYEYIGHLTTEGALTVSDPAYRTESRAILALHLGVRPGVWHAYVLPGRDDTRDRTAALAVMHEEGFAAKAVESLGAIGIDSGLAGVFDKTFPKEAKKGIGLIDCVLHGRGAIAQTGQGDGFYNVFVGHGSLGDITKIRVHFLEDVHPCEIDSTLMEPKTTARPYSPKEHFSVADVIDHVKFGRGTVVAVDDAKIEVAFGDDRRTLAHLKA